MVRQLIGFVIVATGLSPTWAATWAERMFATRSHDFGTVARGAKAEYEFVFTNRYIEDVHVASARSSCSCTSVTIKNAYLKTYEKGAIVARFNTSRFRGQQGATITVRFDKPYPAAVQLHVKGYIRGDVTFEPPGVDFGEVIQGEDMRRTVRVIRHGSSSWRIVDLSCHNPHISAEVIRSGRQLDRTWYDIAVHLRATAPIGYFRDYIKLVTNESNRSEIPLQVDGRICSLVTASPSSLFLGVLQPGQSVTRNVVVRSQKPFRVTGVDSDNKAVKATIDEHSPPRPIHVIPLSFTARQEPGKVVETIRIHTDAQQSPTEVVAFAVVRASD